MRISDIFRPKFSPASKNRTSLQLETLEERVMLSTVQIFAAGVEGSEIMNLEIDGAVAETWTVGGDAYGGQFETYTFESSGTTSPGQIRIRFTNDLYDPANNVDRNIRVDAITIDGIRYETEDPSVFSTGTWLPEDGITPGFRQSEYLHGDGYFQFAGDTPSGSNIEIRARGDEGVENFNLLIDDNIVYTNTVTTSYQTFSFDAPTSVTADQVKLEFTNDEWDPAAGLDHNLVVDFIQIDGVRFETEDPSVYSTGTWLPDDGIQPGFRESETLHTNGFFEYSTGVPANPGNLYLESSIYSVDEDVSTIDVIVLRQGGSDGQVSIDFDTIDNSALAGQDYVANSGTITWADGEQGGKAITITILNDAIAEGDESLNVTIDNVTGDAVLLAPRTATVNILDDEVALGGGDGLLGEYFDDIALLNRFTTRTDASVNFDWQTSAPITGMGANTFSVRWSGQVQPLYSETYTFQTTSDDGVRLWVDNQLIIDQWNDQSATNYTGTIALSGGQLYDIRMEYYENGGSAVAQLRWASPTQPLEVIPQSQLFAADPPDVGGGDLETQTLISGLSAPTSLDFTPDGSNMYVTLKSGIVRTMHNGTLESTPFIDISDMVNGIRDRGLLDIAVHPDFENTPYVYLLFTYDPPEVFQNSGLAGPDGLGNRAGRLIRVTADASNDYKTAVEGSEVVLLGKNSTWDNFNAFVNSTNNFNEPPAGILEDGTNVQDFIASDSESHTVGAIEFGIDGNLFVSIGDGTSYNAVDPRTVRVQDIDNLSGKVLRIDPITGEGLSDNPFFNGDVDANRSKVYQLGLRNPFRMSVDPVSGQLYIGDVGWTQWEEINAGPAGANFGWPYYEGGNGVSLGTNQYSQLPEAQAFYASGETVFPAIYALNHAATGINAIILGDVYTGDAYPSKFQGDLFFNDLGQGIVRNVSFDANGDVEIVENFTTGAQIVVHIQQGPDGNLYFIDLNDGQVGRWVFV